VAFGRPCRRPLPRTLEDYHDKIYKYWWWRTHDARYADTGGQHPQSVTRKEARDYAIYLRNSQKVRWGELTRPGKETLSPASVASYGRVVKVFFAWLITEGYIDDDPFAGKGVSFNTKHKEARVVKVVDAGDLEKIFNYLMNSNRLQYYNGPRNLAIIALLTDSGIRRGELLGLKVDDFDLENNRCMVKRQDRGAVGPLLGSLPGGYQRLLQYAGNLAPGHLP
jgi:integrase